MFFHKLGHSSINPIPLILNTPLEPWFSREFPHINIRGIGLHEANSFVDCCLRHASAKWGSLANVALYKLFSSEVDLGFPLWSIHGHSVNEPIAVVPNGWTESRNNLTCWKNSGQCTPRSAVLYLM